MEEMRGTTNCKKCGYVHASSFDCQKNKRIGKEMSFHARVLKVLLG